MYLCRCGFLTKWPMVGGVLVPVAVVIAYDAVVFTLVMKRLSKKVAGKQVTVSEREELLRRFQNALPFIVLMGLTWVLGFFTVIQTPNDDNIELTFDIIFIILNSFQGVFLFFFYCVRNPIARATWRKFLRKHLPAMTTIMSVNTTETSQSQSNVHSSTDESERKKVRASKKFDHSPELHDVNALSLIETSSGIPSDHQQQEIKHAYHNDIVGDEDIDEVGKDVISRNCDIDVEDNRETSFSGATDEAGFTDLTKN